MVKPARARAWPRHPEPRHPEHVRLQTGGVRRATQERRLLLARRAREPEHATRIAVGGAATYLGLPWALCVSGVAAALYALGLRAVLPSVHRLD